MASGNWTDFVGTISSFIAAPGVAHSLAALAVTALACAAAVWTAATIRKRTQKVEVRKTPADRR